MKLDHQRLVEKSLRGASVALPRSVISQLYAQTVGDLQIALCLHRVGYAKDETVLSSAMATPESLDEMLDIIGPHHRTGRSRLTMAFDDGYQDAVQYVQQRAGRFPSVEWLLMVCPEKLNERSGFRWDLFERKKLRRESVPSLREWLRADCDVKEENGRRELRELGDDPSYALADWSDIERVRRLPNVEIGNHTNCHFITKLLDDTSMEHEVEASARDLEKKIGSYGHFAFPFGTPGAQVSFRDVTVAKATGISHIWTTEQRPYRYEERKPGAVLPRIVHDGRWTARRMVMWIIYRCMRYRAKGSKGYVW